MAEVARDRVRDGRDLMEQDIPDEHVDEFIESVRPWAWFWRGLPSAPTITPKSRPLVGQTCTQKTAGYWGDPSMFSGGIQEP